MNKTLTDIKREAREEFTNWLNEFPGTPSIGEIEQWWMEFADRLLEEVEKVVVPKRDDKGYPLGSEYGMGHNDCREAVLGAFAKFRGEKCPKFCDISGHFKYCPCRS